MIKTYQCDVTFKKGPMYTASIKTVDAIIAKAEAVKQAREFGFNGKVKSVKTKTIEMGN
ncbi:MAG: hypothetical protein KGZ88_12020 [Methylomicrobium sp.]|nr:hypothetical protein [Methylomicrobium sp.]